MLVLYIGQNMSCINWYCYKSNVLYGVKHIIPPLFQHQSSKLKAAALTSFSSSNTVTMKETDGQLFPDSKVHGANMGPTWVL